MLALYISLLDTEEQISKFEHIYTKYRGLMFYTAKGVLQDSYLAEDAVHETFLDIIRIIDSIRANNEKELSQFLRVLTHHKAVDMVRKCTRQKKSDTEIEDLDLSKSDVNVETIVLDKIDYENMLLLVQSMDEKYKTPLLLKVQGYKVSERRLSIEEVAEAADAGKLKEAFGSGTAAVISPIGELKWDEKVMTINNGEIGTISQHLYDTLTGIQWGKLPDPYGWTVEVK